MIVILSFLETLIIGIMGLIIFTVVLLIPAEGIKIKKEFRIDSDGFCIRVERKSENKEE